MNPIYTSKLLAAFPLLFRSLRGQSFECGDGWFDLVWQVSAEIEAAAKVEGTPITAEAWPKVGVLKQKFGTLRFQFNGNVSEAIEALATKAYEQSMLICEQCGAPTQLDKDRQHDSWVKALCNDCRKVAHAQPRIHDETKLPAWMMERDGRL